MYEIKHSTLIVSVVLGALMAMTLNWDYFIYLGIFLGILYEIIES